MQWCPRPRPSARHRCAQEADTRAHVQGAAAAAARRERLEEEARQRAARARTFRKRTERGQPVMKWRVDKVLAQLGAAG